MCEPVTITAGTMWFAAAMAAVAVVGSVVANKNANKSAKRRQEALDRQNQIVADEISDAKGVELQERARAARRERAAMRVSAAESGINLGSNSFLAMLQTSEVNESIDSGLILKNESNQQRARQANHASNIAGIQYKTGLGIALDAAQAGSSAYFGAGGKTYMGRQPGRG